MDFFQLELTVSASGHLIKMFLGDSKDDSVVMNLSITQVVVDLRGCDGNKVGSASYIQQQISKIF